MLKDKTIAVIGVGKMGGTLINSVIKNDLIKKENLFGSTAQEKHAKEINLKYKIKTYVNNEEMILGKDIIILGACEILSLILIFTIIEKGYVTRLDGILLVACLGIYIWLIFNANKESILERMETIEKIETPKSKKTHLFIALLGFGGVTLASFMIFSYPYLRWFQAAIFYGILKEREFFVINLNFKFFKGEIKIVHIRLKNLIYTVGSNNEVQFQLLEAFIEKVSETFNEIYDIESYIKYDNFSITMFSSFKEEIDTIIRDFNSYNLVMDLKVPCMVCNGILPVIVKRSFIENAESYPVPLVYTHKGHAILCFIDKNYDIRGVELVNVTG